MNSRTYIDFCYNNKEYHTGYELAMIFNDSKWMQIFATLIQEPSNNLVYNYKYDKDKETIIIINEGGWKPWNGYTFYTKGLGGCESWSIKYAEKLTGKYNVVFFNNTIDTIDYNKVLYINLKYLVTFLSCYRDIIKLSIISRFTTYIPLMYKHKLDTFYFIHDHLSEHDILIDNEYLKCIYCLSEYHKDFMKKIYTNIKIKNTNEIYYSLDSDKIRLYSHSIDVIDYDSSIKIKYSFIYSSYPDRGLINLLRIFPEIVKKYPEAKLNLYCDFINGRIEPLYTNIEKMIDDQRDNVVNHGWVNKSDLVKAWNTAEFWVYPCTSGETFCITALEAAASKTYAITHTIGALVDTVGDRGVLIKEYPTTKEWDDKVLDAIEKGIDYDKINKNYEWATSLSYDNNMYNINV